jgi:hypothetical protein
MKRIAGSVLASLSLLSACGGGPDTPPAAAPAKPAAIPAAPSAEPVANPAAAPTESPKPTAESPKAPAEVAKLPAETPKPMTAMDAAIKELMARPEIADDTIEIQHILIAYNGAPRMKGITRTMDEANVLAQKVWAEAIAGGDFDALVKQYTNDSAPGIYPLPRRRRYKMVEGFGDVGYRLKVGEIGVAPWHATKSPYGWHIIKRLK